MSKTRVLVVDDSITVRKQLVEALQRDADIEVVAEADDGKTAIEACLSKRPDVITMDMMMPIMTGVAATEYIMAHCPTPILIVSASTNRGELFRTYDALAAGAVEVLEKPKGDEPEGRWEQRFISVVKLVSRIRVITHPRGRLGAMGLPPGTGKVSDLETGVIAPDRKYQLVAIGASTGGPGALVDILRALPESFALPIVIVLHINQPFGQAFADWLDAQTTHRVSFVTHGMLLSQQRGRVLLAPPDQHVVIREGRLFLSHEKERHSCRPSVDVLFESIARECAPTTIACLLTGMGRDGASGLLDIRRMGGFTIAQDEASCVVYGMPREAVQLKAAMRVLALEEIGQALTGLAAQHVAVKA